jgi:tripartite-type tricarboxylate transporter receptor subunit TctC
VSGADNQTTSGLSFRYPPFAILLCCALFAGVASAQQYPVKPVRVVIPWPPGGSNDMVGRVVVQKMSEAMGQQFVVDNRAGASGVLGSELVAKAPADGYTIMVHSTTHMGNAHLYGSKLNYDTLRDFTGVGLMSAQPGALTAHPSLPVKSTKDFIALAKSRPGQVLYSSSGNGSAPHLQMALLTAMAGIKLVHVPYKGGAPQVTALVAGETQVSFATIGTVINQIKAGRLKPLGVGSAKRTKQLPDVPTIAESGVPGYEMSPWIGMFVPAGTPRAVIERLSAEMNKALASADVIRRLEAQALDPWTSTPDEFNARLKVDYEKYGKLIRLTGAKVE